ncbi:hypothetical protein EB796_009610 [Bugula neritina]|uniref:Uncharacterized protein n=1 Tax=Bugula neritina TaxID=10212 RepID=A0A7J7K0F0_BUGNE|nr:hypothetical protein EB796_009610 [Bugula neritina]
MAEPYNTELVHQEWPFLCAMKAQGHPSSELVYPFHWLGVSAMQHRHSVAIRQFHSCLPSSALYLTLC